MEESRQNQLIKYLDYLCSKGIPYASIGKATYSVRLFLKSDFKITRSGYKHFCSANSVAILNRPYIKEYLCKFLDWKGIGYKRIVKGKSNGKTLERIDVVCDRNKKIITDFANYLYTETDLSGSTVSSYVTGAKLYFQYATEFNVEMCRAYIVTIEKNGAAPRTVNLRINALTKLGVFLKKPVVLKRVKIQRSLHTENVPSEAEYNRLLEYLKNKSMNRYFDVKILATTGARISEYLQMTWEDVLKGEVTLKGKGSKYRRFFFSKALVNEAKEYVRKTGATGIVCQGRYGPMSSRGVSSNMQSWAKILGIDKKKMHPHAFRHFFAKMYLRKNKDVVQLAELMGHGSVDTTKIYLQKTYEEQKKDYNKNVTW